MKIAYVSFECPPDTASGGIATYIGQVARMMKMRGHHVEVFSASPYRNSTEEVDGVLVHRVHTDSREDFSKLVLPLFQKRHSNVKFDLFESPEYMGDGYEIKKSYPSLPLVVKLHTPTSFIDEINGYYFTKNLTSYKKFRFLLGGVIRGKFREQYWKQWQWKKKEKDKDYLLASLANQIHTPSISLGDIVAAKWGLERDSIRNVPYPFIPNEKFLDIPIAASESKTVTFLGRLEIRKGLIELSRAIPLVLAAVPDAQFRFVGKSLHSIVPGVSMREYLERELKEYVSNIEFTAVTPEQIPQLLAQTDVCVFPSIWENFPNVCLEAMSAGRAIVASNQGGMNDMLRDPKAGVLVDPLSPQSIADAIINLLQRKDLRVQLGEVARNKVLSEYNTDKIGDLMEYHYLKLIKE